MKFIPLLAMTVPLALVAACGGGSIPAGEESPSGDTVKVTEGEALSDRVVKTAEGGYMMGDPDASVNLVEYGSLVCVHCRDFEQEAYDQIVAMVDAGKISYEFRNFLLGGADIAPTVLTRCAGPKHYFPLTDAWYDNWDDRMQAVQDAISDSAFRKQLSEMEPAKAASTLGERAGVIDFFAARGVSRNQAETCLADEAALDELQQLSELGREQGVTGTPSFYINGEKVDFAGWPALKTALDSAGES